MPDSKMLPDLLDVIENCKERIAAIDTSLLVRIDTKKAEELINAYLELYPHNFIELLGGHTFLIKTGEQTRYISIQEMTTLSVLAENLRALESYREALDNIASDMGFNSRQGEGSAFFEAIPSENWDSVASAKDKASFFDSVNNVFEDQQNRDRILKFVSDPDWSGMKKEDGKVGRKLNRSSDWQESAILKTGGLVAAASAGRVNLIRAIEKAGFGADLVELAPARSLNLITGENVIFYGAPGTGKSNKVAKMIVAAGKEPIRTVFHPDLQNSDFFGSLKPRMDGGNVRYEFAPGPFMEALAEAFKTPDEPVYLVIEELNRAAAAAVFGDVFLLLDRDDDGTGEYSVSFPSPESRVWFEGETGVEHNRISLPSNLFIYATMNSADQGVYPIDTAFRRRWRQEYLPLDYTAGPDGLITYVDADSNQHSLEWREFIEKLNEYLVDNNTLEIAEDRLLGQWFVKKKELNGEEIPGKVLLYLWDDLLRHEGRDQIFNTGRITTYGALAKAAKDGNCFLSGGFLAVLNSVAKSATEEAVGQ